MQVMDEAGLLVYAAGRAIGRQWREARKQAAALQGQSGCFHHI